MTNGSHAAHIVGSLRSAGGKGVVRVEALFDTDIDRLWSFLTDSAHLARWYGQVEGNLHLGGQFRIYIAADDWEGTGRVDACERPLRLAVTTRETDESWRKGIGAEPFPSTTQVSLSVQGDQTALVLEVRGVPLDKVAFYGVGSQIHAENLAAYIAGVAPGDVEARWDELLPAYQDLAAILDS